MQSTTAVLAVEVMRKRHTEPSEAEDPLHAKVCDDQPIRSKRRRGCISIRGVIKAVILAFLFFILYIGVTYILFSKTHALEDWVRVSFFLDLPSPLPLFSWFHEMVLVDVDWCWLMSVGLSGPKFSAWAWHPIFPSFHSSAEEPASACKWNEDCSYDWPALQGSSSPRNKWNLHITDFQEARRVQTTLTLPGWRLH